MKQFLVQRWFLLALAAALVVGIGVPRPFAWLSESKALQNGVVACVLFLMALPLPLKTIWDTLRRPAAAVLGVTINYGVLPLFAWGLATVLNKLGLSDDMTRGILVAAATPCTVASAAVWTRRAGGNDAVAILVMLISSGLCFLLTPFWLAWMTGKSHEFPVRELIVSLAFVVLLPMSLAQVVRAWAKIAVWSTAQKVLLSSIAQCGILTMAFLGAVQSGLRLERTRLTDVIFELTVVVMAVLVIHLTMLWAGLRLGPLFGLSRADAIGVGFAGSQKTLMVGLKAGMALGITILPMVAYHVCQLLVDTLIADRLRTQDGGPSPDQKSA